MKELREIGLEKELFLLKNGKIMEPKLYGFPYDEMGFLVEIRSYPSENFYPILSSIQEAETLFRLRANELGMELIDAPFLEATDEFIQYISTKYKHNELPCLTKNIYGTKLSHHTGIIGNKLTSGIHVHFSSRIGTKILKLPIKEIVKKMDEKFKLEIEKYGRLKGEWEPKAHGFEYRSLPCNTDIHKILKEAFTILNNLKKCNFFCI